MTDAMDFIKDISFYHVLTTNPQRYGALKGYNNYERTQKGSIIRFSTPQHNNSFLKQLYVFFIYSLKAFFHSLRLKNDYDCIIITSSRFGTALLGYIISKMTNKPLGVDIRDIFSDGLESVYNSRKIHIKILIRLLKKLETDVLKHASWINFVSPGFNSVFSEKILKNKVENYTNGIDKIFIQKRIKNQGKILKKPLKILYAGNIGYGQSLEKIIVPLAKSLNGKIIFEIIGNGSSKFLLLQEIKHQKISNIIVKDAVGRQDLINYYNDTDALFLNLNDIDAFERVIPSKIFEYSTFEKPIFAGVTGTAKTFIEKNINGYYLFPPNDIKKARLQIEEVLGRDKFLIDNSKFIRKYERSIIMRKMIKSFIAKIDI